MAHRQASQQALSLVRKFEGFVDHIYLCSAGVKTIGIGHALRPGEDAKWTNGITEEEAYKLLQQDVYLAESSVARLTYVELSDGMFGALVSFVFNLGGGAYQRSSLRSKLNRYEYLDAADEFPKWCYARGKWLKGLYNRRVAERALFLEG